MPHPPSVWLSKDGAHQYYASPYSPAETQILERFYLRKAAAERGWETRRRNGRRKLRTR